MYNFDLPKDLIAQRPVNPRDSARLLVYRLSDGFVEDATFSDINRYLPKDSTVVVNNSKVESCRWLFDNNIEVFVLEKNDPYIIRAMVRPGRRFKIGDRLTINNWLSFDTLDIDEKGIRTLRLSTGHDDSRLVKYEHIPLPPYIAQDDKLALEYQTVYARPLGSLAAPTAGLHFTDRLIDEVKQRHSFAEITLHVGLGTFAKLSEDNFKVGKLHQEWFDINRSTADMINLSKNTVAVGTTAIRTLESAIEGDYFVAKSGYTDIFIRPGYAFKAVDNVVTNFHLPNTSLLMLIAAFLADKKGLSEVDAAHELIRIYRYAIKNRYRFYSFGDAMLIV